MAQKPCFSPSSVFQFKSRAAIEDEDEECGMKQDVGGRIQDMRYGRQDTRCGQWDDAGCEMHNAEQRLAGLACSAGPCGSGRLGAGLP